MTVDNIYNGGGDLQKSPLIVTENPNYRHK